MESNLEKLLESQSKIILLPGGITNKQLYIMSPDDRFLTIKQGLKALTMPEYVKRFGMASLMELLTLVDNLSAPYIGSMLINPKQTFEDPLVMPPILPENITEFEGFLQNLAFLSEAARDHQILKIFNVGSLSSLKRIFETYGPDMLVRLIQMMRRGLQHEVLGLLTSGRNSTLEAEIEDPLANKASLGSIGFQVLADPSSPLAGYHANIEVNLSKAAHKHQPIKKHLSSLLSKAINASKQTSRAFRQVGSPSTSSTTQTFKATRDANASSSANTASAMNAKSAEGVMGAASTASTVSTIGARDAMNAAGAAGAARSAGVAGSASAAGATDATNGTATAISAADAGWIEAKIPYSHKFYADHASQLPPLTAMAAAASVIKAASGANASAATLPPPQPRQDRLQVIMTTTSPNLRGYLIDVEISRFVNIYDFIRTYGIYNFTRIYFFITNQISKEQVWQKLATNHKAHSKALIKERELDADVEEAINRALYIFDPNERDHRIKEVLEIASGPLEFILSYGSKKFVNLINYMTYASQWDMVVNICQSGLGLTERYSKTPGALINHIGLNPKQADNLIKEQLLNLNSAADALTSTYRFNASLRFSKWLNLCALMSDDLRHQIALNLASYFYDLNPKEQQGVANTLAFLMKYYNLAPLASCAECAFSLFTPTSSNLPPVPNAIAAAALERMIIGAKLPSDISISFIPSFLVPKLPIGIDPSTAKASLTSSKKVLQNTLLDLIAADAAANLAAQNPTANQFLNYCQIYTSAILMPGELFRHLFKNSSITDSLTGNSSLLQISTRNIFRSYNLTELTTSFLALLENPSLIKPDSVVIDEDPTIIFALLDLIVKSGSDQIGSHFAFHPKTLLHKRMKALISDDPKDYNIQDIAVHLLSRLDPHGVKAMLVQYSTDSLNNALSEKTLKAIMALLYYMRQIETSYLSAYSYVIEWITDSISEQLFSLPAASSTSSLTNLIDQISEAFNLDKELLQSFLRQELPVETFAMNFIPSSPQSLSTSQSSQPSSQVILSLEKV